MEKQDVGNWEAVGYSAPGTKDNTTSAHTNVIAYSEAANNVWTAKPIGDLNDCTSSLAGWTLTPTRNGTNVGYTPNTGNACVNLTPSWSNFSRGTSN